MNAARRKDLAELNSKLEIIRAFVESHKDDEEAYFEAMPESLQGSEKGEASAAAISALEEALSALEGASAQLDASVQS